MEGKHRVIHMLFTFLFLVQTVTSTGIDPVEFLLSKTYPRNKTVSLPNNFAYSGDPKTDCCSLVLWVTVKDWSPPPDPDDWSPPPDPPDPPDPKDHIGPGVITFKWSHPQIRDGDEIFSMNYVENVIGQVRERFIINFDKCVSITHKVFQIYASTNIVDTKDIRIVVRDGKDKGVNCKPQLDSDPVKFLLSKNYPRQKMIPYVDMMNRCELELTIEIQTIETVGNGAPPLTGDEIAVESGPVYFDFEHPNFENEMEMVEVYFSEDKDKSHKKQTVCFNNCTHIDQKTLSLHAHTRITKIIFVIISTAAGRKNCPKNHQNNTIVNICIKNHQNNTIVYISNFFVVFFLMTTLIMLWKYRKASASVTERNVLPEPSYSGCVPPRSRTQNAENYTLEREEPLLELDTPLSCSPITIKPPSTIFLWNGSDEPLFAVLSYDMRDLDQTRAVNVNVAGGIDLAAGANAAVHVKQKGRKYVMKTGEYKAKLFPHKRTKIPIASTLDKGILQVIITNDENKVVDEFTAQPGNSKIISKMNTTYMVENSRKRARGWGFKAWMPEEGDSKDPHKNLEQGDDCIVCGIRMPSTSC